MVAPGYYTYPPIQPTSSVKIDLFPPCIHSKTVDQKIPRAFKCVRVRTLFMVVRWTYTALIYTIIVIMSQKLKLNIGRIFSAMLTLRSGIDPINSRGVSRLCFEIYMNFGKKKSLAKFRIPKSGAHSRETPLDTSFMKKCGSSFVSRFCCSAVSYWLFSSW